MWLIARRSSYRPRATPRPWILEEDGYALWQIVLAARDMSSNERQLELERQYREYKLSKAMPTPEELEDELLGLLVLWLKIDGNKEDKFSPLINRSLRLLPAGPQVAAEMTSFVGTVRALVGLNVGYKVWAKFEDFVTMIIGQYRSVINTLPPARRVGAAPYVHV